MIFGNSFFLGRRWRSEIVALLICSFSLANVFVFSQVEKKPILAVLTLQHLEPVTHFDAVQITQFLEEELFHSGGYVLVERSQVDRLLNEYQYQHSGVCDVECAVQIGKQLTANKVIIGTVGRLGNSYTIQIRMIDIETATIVRPASIRAECRLDDLPVFINKLVGRITTPAVPGQKVTPEKETVKPEPKVERKKAEEVKKPVVKTRPAVEPKVKKGGFPWLIGALVAGGGIVVAVLAGGGSSGSGSSGPPPPTVGSIQVNSNPTGAKIFHNGSDTGRTTNSTLTNVSAGTHTIKLVREGYVDVEGQVSVTAGQTATFSRTLTRHTISVTAPAAGAVWVPGQEVEIRWTTGGGAAVRAAVPAGSTLAGGAVLDGGLAALRAAMREQALMGRAGVRDGMLYGGLADDRVDAGKTAALRGRESGRTDSPTGQAHQNVLSGGATQPSQDASARAAWASISDRGEGRRFVPPSAVAEFAGAIFSGKPAAQDDTRVLVLSNVGIKLYRGSTEVRTIIARTNNTGSYKWTIPSDQAEGTDYKVRVYCADATEVYGESLNFKIEKRAVETIRGIELIYIPPGEFDMGSNSGVESERPVHRVRITKGFWMSKYLVTQKQWRDVMGTNPSRFPYGDNYPVEQVSWHEAQSFIQRLNQLSGKTFRLPTEAEWEYACRARSTGERYGDINAIAWYVGNSGGSTRVVGTRAENDFGLYDMLGNLWEWVEDWYGENYYSISPGTDPKGPGTGQYRVRRGGSWQDAADLVRSARRAAGRPDSKGNYIGFRIIRTD